MAVEIFESGEKHRAVTVEIDGKTMVGNAELLQNQHGVVMVFRCWQTRRMWLLSRDEVETMRFYAESPIPQP